MAWEDQEDENRIYHVVMNHEDQYRIWPAGREVPAG
ncbi:MAG: MbtH family NRPS accessory protein [Phaeodactylibacter sp.]|nr:MbtH family NRPS accessory protein [Phaeodactylibacter sp.]MCB0614593.1 MbtH family NRPS accessory protein [Phaeodactylibacter sp.]